MSTFNEQIRKMVEKLDEIVSEYKRLGCTEPKALPQIKKILLAGMDEPNPRATPQQHDTWLLDKRFSDIESRLSRLEKLAHEEGHIHMNKPSEAECKKEYKYVSICSIHKDLSPCCNICKRPMICPNNDEPSQTISIDRRILEQFYRDWEDTYDGQLLSPEFNAFISHVEKALAKGK